MKLSEGNMTEQELLELAEANAMHGIIDIGLHRVAAAGIDSRTHDWIKRGPHLECQSCSHSHYVGMNFDTNQLRKTNVTSPARATQFSLQVAPAGDITPGRRPEPKRGRKGAKPTWRN